MSSGDNAVLVNNAVDADTNSVPKDNDSTTAPSAGGPKETKQKGNKKLLWGLALGAIISTFVLGIFLIIFFEGLLPRITQTVIDNATLELRSVEISNPTDTTFDLSFDGVLKKDRAIAARMHDTYLTVFVGEEDDHEHHDHQHDQVTERLRRRVLQAEEKPKIDNTKDDTKDPHGEVELGQLFIPEILLEGYETPMKLNQTFEFKSQEAFDKFATTLIETGMSSWHIKGYTVVTVLGKKVAELLFDKRLPIKGPSFMVTEDDEKAGDGDIQGPQVTGLAAEPRQDGTYKLLTNITITNSGKTAMNPIGKVGFNMTWDGLFLGGLETLSEISIFPGVNDISLTGVWDLTAALKGAGFFEMVKIAKMLNELRLMFKEGEPITLNAKGVYCSQPLYDAAVKAIDADFNIEGFKLDLMEKGDEEVEGQAAPSGDSSVDNFDISNPGVVNVRDFVEASGDVNDEMPVLTDREVPLTDQKPVLNEEAPKDDEIPAMNEQVPILNGEDGPIFNDNMPLFTGINEEVMNEEPLMNDNMAVLNEEVPLNDEIPMLNEEVPMNDNMPAINEQVPILNGEDGPIFNDNMPLFTGILPAVNDFVEDLVDTFQDGNGNAESPINNVENSPPLPFEDIPVPVEDFDGPIVDSSVQDQFLPSPIDDLSDLEFDDENAPPATNDLFANEGFPFA